MPSLTGLRLACAAFPALTCRAFLLGACGTGASVRTGLSRVTNKSVVWSSACSRQLTVCSNPCPCLPCTVDDFNSVRLCRWSQEEWLAAAGGGARFASAVPPHFKNRAPHAASAGAPIGGSAEGTQQESPARQCREREGERASPVGTARSVTWALAKTGPGGSLTTAPGGMSSTAAPGCALPGTGPGNPWPRLTAGHIPESTAIWPAEDRAATLRTRNNSPRSRS
jgi:hypothetical protein